MTAVEIVSGWIAWVVVVGIWLWGMGSFIKWNALMRVYGSDPYEFHGGGYTDLRLKGVCSYFGINRRSSCNLA